MHHVKFKDISLYFSLAANQSVTKNRTGLSLIIHTGYCQVLECLIFYWNAVEEALESSSIALILQYHIRDFNKAALLRTANKSENILNTFERLIGTLVFMCCTLDSNFFVMW